MTYSYPEIKKFSGLRLQANSFDIPSGAMEVAQNVVMTKDGIASKRRGFYEYFDPGGDALNQLATFDSKLLAIFNNGISSFVDMGTSPNETGSRTTLTGETVTISSPRVSRYAQSNKNFYFTTDNGVYKLESSTSTVTKSGMPPALDLRGVFLSANGPLTVGQIAYRVLFGKRDGNENLILGVPSDVLSLTNAEVEGVSWSRTSNVVTVTDSGHNLSVGMSISVSGSAGGSPDVGAGSFTVTGATFSTYTFAETAADSSGTLDYSTTRKPRLEYSVPSEIDSTAEAPFVQIYRASQTGDVTISPTADYKLVTERDLTSAEVTNGFGTFDDGIDDILLGAELYTNPNSREGELQANSRAPLCDDMAFYKEHVFYAATTSRHLISLDVIDSTTMVDGDYVEIEIGGSGSFRRYVGREGVGNQTVKSESVSGTTTITVTYTGHDFAIGDTIFVSGVTGTITEGEYPLTGVAASTFTFTVSTGQTATALYFQGITTLLSGDPYPMFTLDITSLSLSVRLRSTAQGLVKAINRDSASSVYAQYTSGIAGVPGTTRIFAKGFGNAIGIRAISTAAGAGFSPPLTTAFASTLSLNDNQQNALFIGKVSEPEAVPLVNFILVGARNQGILRIAPLRDSLIIIKADGVYRITGNTVGSFTSTALDTTVVCVAASSVSTINNQVIMLSNQGFCLITESSVQIISRQIEDVIQPIVGLADIATATSAVAFETERIYVVSTLQPSGSGDPTITYTYNILNGAWTSWTEVFSQGAIGPFDKLHTITLDNEINRQRKKQTKLDFAGQNYNVQVTAVINSTTLTITSTDAVPEVDWVIVNNNVISRIASVTLVSGDSYTVTFTNTVSLAVTDIGWGEDPWGEFEWGNEVPVMYAGFETIMKMAPFHGGLIGRFKQFAQMQLHQRGAALSALNITFAGPSSATSAAVDWTSLDNTSDSGWGLGLWGSFGWGNEEGISIPIGTQPGSIVRVYVPISQQRSTFIQPILEHNRAAEEINLQAMTFAVRAYQERVSR